MAGLRRPPFGRVRKSAFMLRFPLLTNNSRQTPNITFHSSQSGQQIFLRSALFKFQIPIFNTESTAKSSRASIQILRVSKNPSSFSEQRKSREQCAEINSWAKRIRPAVLASGPRPHFSGLSLPRPQRPSRRPSGGRPSFLFHIPTFPYRLPPPSKIRAQVRPATAGKNQSHPHSY